MSNKEKQVSKKMTLGEFYNHIEAKAQSKRKEQASRSRARSGRAEPARNDRSTRSGGGKLSDRLKSRNGSKGSNWGPNRGRHSDVRTAAKVAGSKPSVNLTVNDDTFPSLAGYDCESGAVPSGAWAQGIQTIIDAKDLPDPAIEAKRLRHLALQEKKRNNRRVRRYSDYDSDIYYDSEEETQESEQEQEPEPTELEVEYDPLAPTADGYDDVDWSDVL